MAAGAQPRPSLDNGPPLPPNLQPQPQPTVQGLAGAPPPNPNGSASLQSAVVQKLMFVEQSLQDIGTILPAAAPVVSGLIDQMRKGMGAILAQGAQPPQASAQAPMGLQVGPGTTPTS